MMMRNAFLFSALLGTVACGGFTPATGKWLTSNFNVTSDTCSETASGTEETMSEQDGEFFLFIDDETGDVSVGGAANTPAADRTACTLEGKVLSCPDSSETEITEDAVMTSATVIGGTFTNSETLNGTYSFSLTCVGTDCETFGIEDCAVAGTFSASFDG
jgi:hypothetical protein